MAETLRLPTSVAIATEMMHALLLGNFKRWYDKRLYRAESGFRLDWSERRYGTDTYNYFLRRVQAFSRTISRMNVQAIDSTVRPLADGSFICDVYGATFLRTVTFHLTSMDRLERACVEINLMGGGSRVGKDVLLDVGAHAPRDAGIVRFLEDGDMAGYWEPYYDNVIHCLRHYKSKYDGCVILGLDALDEDDYEDSERTLR